MCPCARDLREECFVLLQVLLGTDRVQQITERDLFIRHGLDAVLECLLAAHKAHLEGGEDDLKRGVAPTADDSGLHVEH